MRIVKFPLAVAAAGLAAVFALLPVSLSAQTVYVSRMWHQHQPIYWPEWNGNGNQTNRIQYAADSNALKSGGGQQYGTGVSHPDNDLNNIFGLSDRVGAYQSVPRNSLANLSSSAGFCMSYSGSLIDNVRSLGAANQLGYGSGWWNGNREARNWLTPSGSRRMDLVGFTYHHSLGPLLPKSVFRKEIQTFKQAYWKAWGGNSNLSDHSKGFFPTEMAFSPTMIDVLSDEGYQWVIVASHHLSRTCPTYNDKANPTGSFNIKSSPPNKADQLGPSPTSGWWFNEPNPGQATWNVSPHAYQLHRVKYVNPDTGAEKSIIAVPSDDTLSYQAGYSGAQVGTISSNIAPYSTDPSRPVVILPATDGDNAWGGGNSSYFESTPSFFSGCSSAGYQVCAIQDLVNSKPPPAGQYSHIEDGAWIFPESDYGSPYFLKWVEPPIRLSASSTTTYPGTIVDLETPGFTSKFYNWAAIITGANWCETAEQIFTDPTRPNPTSERRTVDAWRIQAPYDWDGTWTSPNDPELAWHIYLGALDSGFNYYGGLGNDDEVKPTLAMRRAYEKVQAFVNANLSYDKTPPTVFRPQRFPWNPGAYTFGWFNSIPGGNTSYLKKMPSDFYVWTHAYDVSGVQSVNLKVRVSTTGTNSMSNNDNETYAGGSTVGSWITIPMTKRTLPNTRTTLNAAANNSQIDYFITPPVLADYYFAKVTDANVSGFRGKLLDYYIEATDTRSNTSKSDIQHVFVSDDGAVTTAPPTPTNVAPVAISGSAVNITWTSSAGANNYLVKRDGNQIGTPTASSFSDNGLTPSTTYSYTVTAQNGAGDSAPSSPVSVTTFAPPSLPAVPSGLAATVVSNTQINLAWNAVSGATSYVVKRNGTQVGTPASNSLSDTGLASTTAYSYTVAASNGAGTSSDSPPVSAATQAAPQNFTMDGAADFSGYLVASPGMTIYAAIRGSRLYVATWSTGSNTGGANDHFIFVSDSVLQSGTTAAPWSKAGGIAIPSGKPFLAAESTNGYAGWSNAPATSEAVKSAASSGQLEGSIDLAAAFGSVPPVVYISAAAYQTANGGILGAQAPTGNADGNIDANEFLALPTASIRDSMASGTFDRLDPARGFAVQSVVPAVGGGYTVTWKVVPGRKYSLEYTDTLGAANTWTALIASYTSVSGEDIHSYTDSSASSSGHRFYRVKLLP